MELKLVYGQMYSPELRKARATLAFIISHFKSSYNGLGMVTD